MDDFFERNPHTSQRGASNETGISRRSIGRILKELHYHPYKLQLTHELGEEDFAARVEFSLSQLAIIADNPDFPERIFFSDEAIFSLHGGVNRHNYRYWSKENPHWVMAKPIYSEHVTVWAGICAKGVIGPYFFNGTVNGARYEGKAWRGKLDDR